LGATYCNTKISETFEINAFENYLSIYSERRKALLERLTISKSDIGKGASKYPKSVGRY
jgi:hypothetical protein